jgi:hypothetical protein
MAAEPERGPSSSSSLPAPVGARIGALIFLVLVFIAFLTALSGLIGLVWSIAVGEFPNAIDYLVLALGGTFFSVVFLMIVREFRATAKRYQRARRLAAGRCPRCGYDIRNLPEPRCPECGETWSADEVEGR